MQKTNLQQAAANIFTDGELYIKPLFQDLFYFKIYLHTVSHTSYFLTYWCAYILPLYIRTTNNKNQF